MKCKPDMFKDKNGLCSEDCSERFPHSISCSDDGKINQICEFGYHLGLYNSCLKTTSYKCNTIIDGTPFYWNEETWKCE